MTLTLPWPPSVNHYYARNASGGVRLDDKAVAYRWAVLIAARDQRAAKLGTKRVRVVVGVHEPEDKRKHDLGNVDKALMDALQAAKVFDDDEQVDDVRYVRGERRGKGLLVVEVEEIT